MRPIHILLLLFLTVPLLEIFLLIEVGGLIGTIPTVFLVVFTAVFGAMLLRAQGLATVRRLQESMARGEMPAVEMIEGMFLVVGGALLLTPGFFTDMIGFLCLLTPLRRAIIRRWLRQYMQPPPGGPGPQGPAGTGSGSGPRIIEGEFTREDD